MPATVQGNDLLAQLPSDARDRLDPFLTRIETRRGEALFEYNAEVRHLVFPETAVLSLLATTGAGETIEVGVIGREAFVGAAYLLGEPRSPCRVIPQIGGAALRLDGRAARREFDRREAFHERVLQHVVHLVAQSSQSALCNHFHSFEERLCRWLVAMHDRVDGDVLALTHEIIANMLGAPRSSVTALARKLQAQGLIRYRWGQITVLDRPALEQRACECYSLLQRHFPSTDAVEPRADSGRRPA